MSAPVCVLFGSVWIGLLLRRVPSASHEFVYGLNGCDVAGSMVRLGYGALLLLLAL